MKQKIGIVTSIKMAKSAVVKIDRFWRHPIYKKNIRRRKNYLCHTDLKVNLGDKVLIKECRPISRKKKFKIIKVIK